LFGAIFETLAPGVDNFASRVEADFVGTNALQVC
jgi:hypothetical protein